MPKILRLGGFTACVSVALIALAAGCKTECKRGTSQCVSGSLIRTCVPTNGGSNEWLISQCGANEVCAKNGAVLAADGGSSSGGSKDAGGGSTSDGGIKGSASGLAVSGSVAGPACVGTCVTGEKDCVSDALSKICVNGGAWALNPCDVGKKCDDTGDIKSNPTYGECVVSSGAGTVQACKPGTMECAGTKQEKICDADGVNWTTTPCAANLTCVKDHCVPDPASSCDDMNTCIDNKTAARCLGKDKGFELVTCPKDTYCQGGVCRGSACAIGSTCTGGNVRECTDGKSFSDTKCAVNEVCQQNGDKASCVPLECKLGATVCGDPRDPKADPTKTFTTCVTLPAPVGSASGVPGWVSGQCTGVTTCDPATAATPPPFGQLAPLPCKEDCTPGAEGCAADPNTGIAQGTRTCLKTGKWGPVTSCNTGTAHQLSCAVEFQDASKLPKAVCAEPVCKYWLDKAAAGTLVLDGTQGFCAGDKITKCLADGTLGAAAACANGACANDPAVGGPTVDGRTPGMCTNTPVCTDGETLCGTAGGTPGRYQTCVNGQWGPTFSTCTGTSMCFNTTDAKGLRATSCQPECLPGSRQCDPTTPAKLMVCLATGKWPTAGTACKLGSCATLGTGGITDAACQVECVPGDIGCGATGHGVDGAAFQAICGKDGTYATGTACATGTTCRISGNGVGLGCVQCVGPNVAGGNQNGVTDSQCDPTDVNNKKLQDCGTNNKWKAATTCAGTTTCNGPTPPVCQTCMGENTTFQCTETNIENEPVCGKCPNTVNGVSVSVCSDANVLAAYGNAGTHTCANEFTASVTTSGPFGGVTDCCSNAHSTAYADKGTMCTSTHYNGNYGSYGSAVAGGGVLDCCSSYLSGVSGGLYAYCN